MAPTLLSHAKSLPFSIFSCFLNLIAHSPAKAALWDQEDSRIHFFSLFIPMTFQVKPQK